MSASTLLMIVASVTMSSLAQLFLKTGMSGASARAAGGVDGQVALLAKAALNAWVVGGLTLYFLSTLVWLAVLSREPVSKAYPFVGLGFVMTMLLGWGVLHESLTPAKVAGTLLVIAGVVLIARSS
jgi:multidrug transporter EmrE-like cation transporter